VPEPRTPAAAAPARPLPRIHRRHARPRPPRRTPHRHRRRSAGRVVLHRGPLPQLSRLRTRGPAMIDIEIGALLADASQAAACFVHIHDRAALVETATTLDFKVVAV